MKKFMTGNDAASWGARLARAEFLPAFPITPSTPILEALAGWCAKGEMRAEFKQLESEHSVMAAAIGASAAGARVFTATASQGLAYMHEVLHWAAGARTPMVLVNCNRSLGAPWNTMCDQNDSLSQRDTGWIQLYCETAQEVLDTVVQGFKLSERVRVPVMVCLDGFFLSHASETVEVPEAAEVDAFLPPPAREGAWAADGYGALGASTRPEGYYKIRYELEMAMERALEEADAVRAEWAHRFGRDWPLVEAYGTEEAETAILTSAATVGTARVVVDRLRERGERVGLVKMKMFRPFPSEALRKALWGVKKVCVVDRNLSYGRGGIFFQEAKAALADMERPPQVYGYVAGLGGGDITMEMLEEIVAETRAARRPTRDIHWKGVPA